MLDNHGEWSNAWVDGDIGLDHFCIHQSQWCVDVHIAGEVPRCGWKDRFKNSGAWTSFHEFPDLQFRVPQLHDGHFGSRNAKDFLHAMFPKCVGQHLHVLQTHPVGCDANVDITRAGPKIIHGGSFLDVKKIVDTDQKGLD